MNISHQRCTGMRHCGWNLDVRTCFNYRLVIDFTTAIQGMFSRDGHHQYVQRTFHEMFLLGAIFASVIVVVVLARMLFQLVSPGRREWTLFAPELVDVTVVHPGMPSHVLQKRESLVADATSVRLLLRVRHSVLLQILLTYGLK